VERIRCYRTGTGRARLTDLPNGFVILALVRPRFAFTERGLHVLVGLNILGLRHEVGEGLWLCGSVRWDFPKGEFALLSKIASEAHEKCVAARERFYKHMAEHGC
jgi:hypothetical protein